MKSIHNDTVLGATVAIFATVACLKAAELGAQAQFLPLTVLVPSVFIGVIIAVRGQLKLHRTGENPAFFQSPRRFFLLLAVLILTILGVEFLGFLTTTFFMIPILSFLLGYRRPIPIAVTTLLFVALVYIVFIQILARPLPAEIWTTWGS